MVRVFLRNDSISYPETEVLAYDYADYVPSSSHFGFASSTSLRARAQLVDNFSLEVSDGVGDACDNCPQIVNSGQQDTDLDGDGDVCDSCTDVDMDGFGNGGFALNTCERDNCPSIHNPTQSDVNGDGTGDACSPFSLVSVVNLPGPLNVSGTVEISNLPSIQAVTGHVEVTNLPVNFDGEVVVSGPRVRNRVLDLLDTDVVPGEGVHVWDSEVFDIGDATRVGLKIETTTSQVEESAVLEPPDPTGGLKCFLHWQWTEDDEFTGPALVAAPNSPRWGPVFGVRGRVRCEARSLDGEALTDVRVFLRSEG